MENTVRSQLGLVPHATPLRVPRVSPLPFALATEPLVLTKAAMRKFIFL